MYRFPKFLDILHEIREEMSRDADFDIERFAEMVRTGENLSNNQKIYIQVDKNGKPLTAKQQKLLTELWK